MEPVIRNERLYEFHYREICSFFPIKKKKKKKREASRNGDKKRSGKKNRGQGENQKGLK